jgi:hypothetical protein
MLCIYSFLSSLSLLRGNLFAYLLWRYVFVER